MMNLNNLVILSKRFTFEAAHCLNDYKGKCVNIHGHSYKLYIEIIGEINNNGFVMDFNDIKKNVEAYVIEELDHKLLNDILPKPTAENLCIYIYNRLKKPLGNKLYGVKLFETENSYAYYCPIPLSWRKNIQWG